MIWYQKVHEGTHVYIDFRTSIDWNYVRGLPTEFICKYPQDNLRYGSTPLTGVDRAWIYRKNFEFRNFMDLVSKARLKVSIQSLLILHYLDFNEVAFLWLD